MPTSTGYTVNTGTAATPIYTDLVYIFKPLASSTQAAITGFQDSSGKDLNQLFDPLLTGQSSSVPKTYLISASTGGDLNTVFAPITSPTPTDISYNVTGDYFQSYNSDNQCTAVVFTIPLGKSYSSGMSGSIQFNQDVSANLIIVGGGAGGGTYYTYNYGNTTYYWNGCGGGGGGVITTPINLTGLTTYQLVVGQGGKGGSSQQTGTSSYFINNTNKYIAYGGSVASSLLTNGFINSSGGEVSITNNGPSGWTGWGGGGGGGESSSDLGGTGGTGGSYNGSNPGQAGWQSYSYYSNSSGNSYSYGGTGGKAYITSIPISFADVQSNITSMPGGGGGGAGTSIVYYKSSPQYFCGFAGRGIGGQISANSSTAYYGSITNACNNSYSALNVTSSPSTASGKTGLAGGYGGGGGATYLAYSTTTAGTGGNGGNGCVIVWWYTPTSSQTQTSSQNISSYLIK